MSPTMIIVGGGLSGYFASYLARLRGIDVINIAQGRGGFVLSHGHIDVWKRASPAQAINKLRQSHPYALSGLESLRLGIDEFTTLMKSADYQYFGDLSSNLSLPSAAGYRQRTSFTSVNSVEGNLEHNEPFFVANIPIFRDFAPDFFVRNAIQNGIPCEASIELPIPDLLVRRNPNAMDLARLFDQMEPLTMILNDWKGRLIGVRRLAVPAILGYARPFQALKIAKEILGISIFEVPTLPPSIPGLRLERIFRRELTHRRVDLVEGQRAIGLIDGRSQGRRVSGVQLQGPSVTRTIQADAVILASGGFLHGGLVAFNDGRVHESVFDLPVSADSDRENWTSKSFLSTQPYSGFGILVDDYMRPRGADGNPIFENLFACGGIIAGSDREIEGSRQGIDLATAYRAVQSAEGLLS